ncbi:MAG: metallophosphoesterase [Clostridia bacterium]|nr:metallophosphoesterase [Clostridia bacterium]
MAKQRVRVYHTIHSAKISKPLTLAVAADLHTGNFDDVMPDFRQADAILVPGDLVNRHRKTYAEAARFLQEAPKAAPVFYSMGNHERKCAYRREWMELVKKSEVIWLDDDSTLFEGIRIGGLSSQKSGIANRDFLDQYEQEKEFKLLMCHHPEMWRDYVQGRDIDFTICGHAHGGQVQIFGQGLYAPGQGFFPKLTHGVHDGGRMMISRGMTNGARAPRINDPCELIILRLEPEKG